MNDIVIAIDGEDTSTHTHEEIVRRKFCRTARALVAQVDRAGKSASKPTPNLPRVTVFRSIIWTPPPDPSPLVARARPRRQGNLHSDADAQRQGLTSPETSHFLQEPSAADTTPHRRRSLRVLASPRATTDDLRSALGLGAISSRSCRRQQLLIVVVGVLVVAAKTPAQWACPPAQHTAAAPRRLPPWRLCS